ncbi:methyltransferase domain-containing protein [Seohaeicola zhoushanensis]|uniref:Ubiquinone/menaquinone biosynthesis methyltransferase n=1 Tax=Seohaeicola zhoushanensis TaxID=1569283 RepID=A0A8J3H2Y9_9RHOB|nr:methyltransferase domain-containing protein [Seohaeicola zhoushanensis]GHF69524.1 ubiquinone/menaquinone biosynthesis methyltransferase [Seohaeicola zhoushanensis]
MSTTFADRYETTLVPVIFRPWAQELIRRAAPRTGEHVLDLACGTGAVSQELLRAGVEPGSLTGADISAGMLAVARRKAEEAGIASDWVEAEAGQLPFVEGRFDLAFCQQALQFFPDRPAALRELRRVLRPGGRVAFCVSTDLEKNPLLVAQAATLDTHAGPDAGAAVRAICGLPDGAEIGALFEGAGFEDVAVEEVSLELVHPDGRAFAAGALGGMHTGDKLSRMSDAERERCIDDFLTALGPCFDGTALRFPHVSNVVTARA